MRVVVDANLIIERDWHLNSGAAEVLLAAARRGRVRLVVPEVVAREVIAAYAERKAATKSKLQAVRVALRKLEGPLSYEASLADDEPFMQRTYDSWLRERPRENRVEVPPVPEVSESLLDRALRRRRPFDSRGRDGFRDALIWQTVLDGASEAQVTVFATDNTKDFASEDKSALHQHLIEDLSAKQLGEAAVKRVGSLEEAARVALEPAQEVLDRLQHRLSGEPDWSDDLLQQMRQEAASEMPAIDDTGVDIGIEPRGEPFDGDVIDSELEDLSITGPPLATDAFPLADNVYSVQLEASGEAVYRLEVSTSGFWHRSNVVPTDLVLSLDERSAYFSGFARVRALFHARYRADADELTNISLMGLIDD